MARERRRKRDKQSREHLSGVDTVRGRKAILVSPELCIGCRACQTACKQWNKLPAQETVNLGSYENPPDLSPNLYNRIRFVEVPSDESMKWLFVSQRCMHCKEAGCMEICPAPGALYRTQGGVVAFNKDICIGCKLCVAGCPFDIPRYDENDKISKCHLCSDRIENGLEPSCTKVCPTNALHYGARNTLLREAKTQGFAALYGEADLGGLGVLYAFKDPPDIYGMPESPGYSPTIEFWKYVLKPLALIGLGGAVVASAAHYLTVGPNEVDEGGEKE